MSGRLSRREFLYGAAAAGLGLGFGGQAAADFRLEIAPLALEIAPGKVIHTFGYNGQAPGPLLRWPEGKPVRVAVTNRTDTPEIVHWHGMFNASAMDGAMEEGSPMIAPGATFEYAFTPRPAGFRWYHTHTFAGHNLKKGQYGAQFGCFYVEPRGEPGAYDQELFLTLHDWNGYMGGGGDSTMDVLYDYATIDGRMLGHGEPIRVREGQRVLLHLLNASANVVHWIALSAHEMEVVAMDGNAVPRPGKARAVRLAPAERLDLLIEMNHPGVWVLGETRDAIRSVGMGVVVEYANATGAPQWVEPAETTWDYAAFAAAGGMTPEAEPSPDERIPLLFQSKFKGHGDFDYWMINGKSYPHTDVISLREGKRYRLVMTNQSMDDHPIHLHRHTFEVTSLEGKPLSGLHKDVVIVKANTVAEIVLTANNPGATLFHCHQQSHMDLGFMMLFAYR